MLILLNIISLKLDIQVPRIGKFLEKKMKNKPHEPWTVSKQLVKLATVWRKTIKIK